MKTLPREQSLRRPGYFALILIAAGLVTLTLDLPAQLTGTSATVSKKPVRKPVIDPVLAAQLAEVEKLPMIEADTLPCGGTFYSAQCPTWPPFPGNVLGLPVWDLGDGCYLVNDLAVDYASPNTTELMSLSSAALDSDAGGITMNETMQSGVPYLTITPTNSDQAMITVLNDTGPANYQIWWTPVLADPAYPWTAIALGTNGQTNFTVSINVYPTGFYRAVWETNSVPLWQAADPSNPGAGILAVFIDSPANGAVLQ
jgi:hypothetical protein